MTKDPNQQKPGGVPSEEAEEIGRVSLELAQGHKPGAEATWDAPTSLIDTAKLIDTDHDDAGELLPPKTTV